MPLLSISGRAGNSFGGTRREKSDRPLRICASSSPTSTDTFPGSRERTMSENSRAGRTALPSATASAGVETRMVRSRSEPTNSTCSPDALTRKFDSTGSAEREDTARPALPMASLSDSRSQLNFKLGLRTDDASS
jgi:hypothetical protein